MCAWLAGLGFPTPCQPSAARRRYGPGLRARFIPLGAPLVVAGIAAQVAALLLAVWARRSLSRHWSGIIATHAEHTLVRAGPYRWVRRPIYRALLGLTWARRWSRANFTPRWVRNPQAARVASGEKWTAGLSWRKLRAT